MPLSSAKRVCGDEATRRLCEWAGLLSPAGAIAERRGGSVHAAMGITSGAKAPTLSETKSFAIHEGYDTRHECNSFKFLTRRV